MSLSLQLGLLYIVMMCLTSLMSKVKLYFARRTSMNFVSQPHRCKDLRYDGMPNRYSREKITRVTKIPYLT